MDENSELSELVQRIVKIGYPELITSNIKIQWGRTSSFATVSWTQDYKNIQIRCNKETKDWHEAALTGLLSHELSHPAQRTNSQSERSTDLDAISRGFGPYLGVERLITGKCEDHIIKRGKDRYLGYRSIRSNVNENELIHLDALLQELRLVPQRQVPRKRIHHDIVIIHSDKGTKIHIDGHEFNIPIPEIDSEIWTAERGDTTVLFVGDKEVESFVSNQSDPFSY
ncbi:MAG: hypothetical protein RTV72_09050 [Candidatus Thorarchaeota archaeon]